MTVAYYDTHDVDLDQLTILFNSVGWNKRTADRDRLAQLARGSTYVILAYEDDRLVGFARAISDGAFNAYISKVAVLPDSQMRGIGRELVRRLMDGRDGIQIVLHANERADPFYQHIELGFERFENVLVRPRKY